jgi:integrase
MAYVSAKNGFDDPKSSYRHTVDENGVHHVSGVYYLNNVAFRFSLNEQKKGYRMRGRISVISPSSGRVLKKIGSARRKLTEKWNDDHPGEKMEGKALERLNIFSELNVNSLDDEAIKKRIAEKAAKLFAKNAAVINADLKEMGAAAQHTASQAAMIYKNEFLKTCCPNVTDRTRQQKERIIDRVTAELSAVPMGKITPAMLKHYARNHENSWEEDLRTAEKFWEFCCDRGVYREKNPITAFLQDAAERKRKKSTENDMNKAAELVCLPEEVEKKLNDRIRENIGDGGFIGIALVKEGGVSSQDACALRWKDIRFNSGGFVSIHLELKGNAGATHDYTRPIFPFGAEVLMVHRSRLLELYSEDELNNLPVVTPACPGKKPISSKKLTQLCRTELLRAGIGEDNMLPIKGEPVGVGIQLLLRNYRYRLEHYCGLASDPAAVTFLTGHSLQHDVTADHYRGFTSPEGQRYLYNAMKRDGRFVKVNKGVESSVTNRILPDGRVERTFTCLQPDKILFGCLSFTLAPGEMFEISAEQGLSLKVQAEEKR